MSLWLILRFNRFNDSSTASSQRDSAERDQDHRADDGLGTRHASNRTPQPALEPQAHYIATHDPNHEKYSPSDIALGTSRPSAPWEVEKRKEPWATEREGAIREWISTHLPKVLSDAEVTTLECKQRTCKVAVATDRKNDIMGQYPIAMLAPSTSMTISASGELEFYLMYPLEMLDPSRFNEFVTESFTYLQAQGETRADHVP
jgi:hypothetical protein